MRTSAILSLLSAALLAVESQAFLSGRIISGEIFDPIFAYLFGTEEASEEELLFNKISAHLVPQLNTALQGILSQRFDPLDLRIRETDFLGGINVLNGFCGSDLEVGFGLGLLSGLGSMFIDTFELEEGSQEIERAGFLGLGASRFTAVFNLITKMEDERNLVADMDANVKITMCDLYMEQGVAGSAGFYGATSMMRVKIGGTLIRMFSSATVTEATVEEFVINYDEVDVGMDGVDGMNGVDGVEDSGMHTYISSSAADKAEAKTKEALISVFDDSTQTALDVTLPVYVSL